MPKIFAEHSFILVVKQLSLRNRLIISAVILMSILASWSFFFYLPLCQNIHNKQARLLLLNKEQKLFEHTQKNITFYHVANERLKQELVNLAQDPFFSLDGLSLLLYRAQKFHLQCKKIKPLASKNASLFTKELYTVHLCGLFEDTMMFLKDVGEIVAPIFLSNIEIARSEMGNVDVLLRLENMRYNISVFDCVLTTSRQVEKI